MKKLRLYIILILAFLCIGFAGAQTWTHGLSFPSFTDTTDPNGWRSWICFANPYGYPADYKLEIYNQNGICIGGSTGRLPAVGSIFIRPRNLVGYDCAGSAVVVSTMPFTGILEKTRNSNQMTNSYSAEMLAFEYVMNAGYNNKNIKMGTRAATE